RWAMIIHNDIEDSLRRDDVTRLAQARTRARLMGPGCSYSATHRAGARHGFYVMGFRKKWLKGRGWDGRPRCGAKTAKEHCACVWSEPWRAYHGSPRDLALGPRRGKAAQVDNVDRDEPRATAVLRPSCIFAIYSGRCRHFCHRL